MLSIEQAQDEILSRIRVPGPGAIERVSLLDAVGRVLARDVASDVDLPPFSRSTMDGYAVRAVDAAGGASRLRIVGESAAGRPAAIGVGAGETVKIFTGAMLPAGADAVVMVEKTVADGDHVRIEDRPREGQNIARRGEDLSAGAVALAAGHRVSTGSVGLLASVGATDVDVVRRPVVSILATGTELVRPSEVPGPGQIRESNGTVLAALVRSAGGAPRLLASVPDREDEIVRRTEEALEADVVLLSGGSSVGDYDFTPAVLRRLGVEIHFDRVSLKPGKPTLFGTRGETAVFGLPGNPISAFVVYHLLVRAALLRRLGVDAAAFPRVVARLEEPIRRLRARDQFLPARVRLDGGRPSVAFVGWNGSGDVTCLNRANALVFVPHGEGSVAAGEETWVTPLDAGRAGDVSVGVA